MEYGKLSRKSYAIKNSCRERGNMIILPHPFGLLENI